MTLGFTCEIEPFKHLSATDKSRLRATALHVSLSPDTLLLRPEAPPDYLWIIRSGHVQCDDAGHARILGADQSINWLGVITGYNKLTIKTLDAVTAWQIPRAVLLPILGRNQRFSIEVFGQLNRDLRAETDADHEREMTSLMLAQVKDTYLQKPFYVDGQLDLVSVCRILAAHRLTNTLVRDNSTGTLRVGIFTTTDLRDALLHAKAPHQLKVAEVSQFDLISLSDQSELFDALLIMLRHRIHRVLVRNGQGEILGILSQLDLMSFMSDHSHLITLQVQRAQTLDDLQAAALLVDESVVMLQRGGLHIEIISRLVSELNSQLFARLWTLLAPPELIQNSCLLVMGSEGRGEQLLKTDQDNAILLREGYTHPALADVTAQFSAMLLRFGYPPCPGNIMVTNPLWCQEISTFRQTVTRWIYGGEADGTMNLAIFMDARAVAGDAALLDNARSHMLDLAANEFSFLSRMTSAIDQFLEPGSNWWSRFSLLAKTDNETIDLKKIGTFPIVHGVRALSLQYRITALGTLERLQTLGNRQLLPETLVRDLGETLHMLMALKLRNNLRQRDIGKDINNLVEIGSLGALDREQLRKALSIIRQFKQYLRVHYRLSQ